MIRDYKTSVDYRSVPIREMREFIDPEQTLGFCRECPIYNRSWSCPPFTFDPLDIWDNYETVDIILLEIRYGEKIREMAPEKQRELGMLIIEYEKLKLLEDLYHIEAQVPGSRLLGAGTCTFCELEGGCAKDAGLACRHPDLMRYSIESLGGDVVSILDRYFDKSVQWTADGTLPEYHTIVFGLLRKNDSNVLVSPQKW